MMAVLWASQEPWASLPVAFLGGERDGRGAWRCVADETGKTKALATVLDFTFARPSGPKQQIGRLNFEVHYDAETKMVGGSIVLYFMPLAGDPLAASALRDGRGFEFTGQRVEAP